MTLYAFPVEIISHEDRSVTCNGLTLHDSATRVESNCKNESKVDQNPVEDSVPASRCGGFAEFSYAYISSISRFKKSSVDLLSFYSARAKQKEPQPR
jgi:hypothetical protein